MKKRRYVLLAIMVLACILLIPGIQQYSQAQTATPQHGGVLKIIFNQAPSLFGNPPELTGTNYACAYPALESLAGRDTNLRFTPTKLATNYVISADGKSITLSLRKGVKFHDGTDFNAKAAKWNLDRAMEGKQSGTSTWTSIDIIDDYTVRINMSQYDSTVLYNLGSVCGIMISPTAFEKYGLDKIRAHPVGTGPFKFVSFEPEVRLKYAKFEDYWQKGFPYLDGLEFNFIKDTMVQAAAFEAGEGHIIYRASHKQARDLNAKGYEVIANQLSHLVTFFTDSARPGSPFADKRVREAIEYAIDRDAIAKATGYGFSKGLHQLAIPGYVGYNEELKGRPYNPEKAKQLLAEAGYKDGFRTKLSAETNCRDQMVAVQGFLSKVGIRGDVEIITRGKYTQYRSEGHTGLFAIRVTLGGSMLMPLERIFPDNKVLEPMTRRPPGWGDLLKAAALATDPDKYEEIVKKLVKVMYEELDLIPLYGEVQNFILRPNVHDTGFMTTGPSLNDWTPEKTWLSK